VNIVKSYYAGLKAVVSLVITAELFCKQFFPTVSRLGFRRIGIFFPQWSYVRASLLTLTVHAGGRREQKPADVVQAAGFQHMRVDQDVVAGDVGVKSSDITDAAHIGAPIVNLIETTPPCLPTSVPTTKIEESELAGLRGLTFGVRTIET